MVVINNAGGEQPARTEGSNSLVNLVLGLAGLIVLAIFLMYVLPGLFSSFQGPATNVNVPDQVDVNVQGGVDTGDGAAQ
ncbi:MAG: hypothetical protein M3Q81_05035 [bacterium]|nr:hypothetical protein [bacterium]